MTQLRSSTTDDSREAEDGFWASRAPRDPDCGYEEAHEWLRELSPNDSLSWIFGSFRGLKSPLVDRKPKELLLGVYSFDPVVLEYVRSLTFEFNKEFTPSLDDKKFVSKNGVHKSFDAMQTVAGYCSQPMSYTVVNNDLYCESLGLSSKTFKRPRHKEIFWELMQLAFSQYKYRPLRVPKLSTAGFPTGTSSEVWKHRAGAWLLRHMEEPLELVGKGSYWQLAKKYGVVFLYKQQKRTQVDPPGKKRWAFNLEYALSGGRRSEPVAVDKSVKLPGGDFSDFSAVRVRSIHGAPFLTNIPLQAISTGVLYALFDWAGPTFHHTDMTVIAEKIEVSGDAVFSDISNYDMSMREFILRELMAVCREFMDERLVKWCETLLFAPYFTQPVAIPDGPGGPGFSSLRPQMIGDPRDPENAVIAGNRSGHAWTSLIAKLIKFWDTLCVIDDLTGDVVGNVREYATHKMPLKVVNNGDDEGLIGPPAMVEAFRNYRFSQDSNPGYFAAEPEDGQIFSGFMFMKEEGRVRAVPRLHTTFEKIYCPERSIGGNFRPYWADGVEDRLTLDLSPNADYSQNPSLGKALDIHNRLWHDKMAKKYGSLVQIIMQGKLLEPVREELALTRIEREIRDRPEKLIYKYTDEDVSPEFLKMIGGSSIMPHVYAPFIEQYYRGTILNSKEDFNVSSTH